MPTRKAEFSFGIRIAEGTDRSALGNVPSYPLLATIRVFGPSGMNFLPIPPVPCRSCATMSFRATAVTMRHRGARNVADSTKVSPIFATRFRPRFPSAIFFPRRQHPQSRARDARFSERSLFFPADLMMTATALDILHGQWKANS